MKTLQSALILTSLLIALNSSDTYGQNARYISEKTDVINQNTQRDSSMNFLKHHLNSFLNNDLEAVISDYTSESVLITPAATYTGPQEIREFFAELVKYFPKQKTNFGLDRTIIKNDLIYIIWHAKSPLVKVDFGSDTFIIKDGKIHQQTYAAQLQFIK
jgi:predicted SnoaL-like aldol condensation-catalyzing enzyme